MKRVRTQLLERHLCDKTPWKVPIAFRVAHLHNMILILCCTSQTGFGIESEATVSDVLPKSVIRNLNDIHRFVRQKSGGVRETEFEATVLFNAPSIGMLHVGNGDGKCIRCVIPESLRAEASKLKYLDRICLTGSVEGGMYAIQLESIKLIGSNPPIKSEPLKFILGSVDPNYGTYRSINGLVEEIVQVNHRKFLWVACDSGMLSVELTYEIAENARGWLGKKIKCEGVFAKEQTILTTGESIPCIRCMDLSQLIVDEAQTVGPGINVEARTSAHEIIGVIEAIHPEGGIIVQGNRYSLQLADVFQVGSNVRGFHLPQTKERSQELIELYEIGRRPISDKSTLHVSLVAHRIPNYGATSVEGEIQDWELRGDNWYANVFEGNSHFAALMPGHLFLNGKRPSDLYPAGCHVRFRGVVDRTLARDEKDLFVLLVGRLVDTKLLRLRSDAAVEKLGIIVAITSGLATLAALWVILLRRQIRIRTLALKQMQDETAHIDKMNAVSRLAGGVAHDFNNLLTAISANLNLAEMDADNPAKLRERVAIARSAVDRAGTLTKHLCDFARQKPLDVRIISVGDVLEQVSSLIRHVLAPTIDFRCHIPNDLPFSEADPDRLEQVFLNLCFNARDALSHPYGLISLSARSDHHEKIGECVRVSVRDDGIGIPPDVRSRIFDPFFTTKPVGAGTGLGLSTALSIVIQHQGLIECHSVAGQGSCFDVLLPSLRKVRLEQPYESKSFASIVASPVGKLRILVVDDDALLRDSTAQLLEVLGHGVECASNGQEALEKLQRGMRYDLILLDLTMPVMSGGEALVKIRNDFPKTFVVVCSGYAQESEMVLLGDNAIKPDRVLSKPFRMQELSDILNACPRAKSLPVSQNS